LRVQRQRNEREESNGGDSHSFDSINARQPWDRQRISGKVRRKFMSVPKRPGTRRRLVL
jgi:hypothetical protein